MGRGNSKASQEQNPEDFYQQNSKAQKQKKVYIQAGQQIIKISIKDSSYTCGWLLSEVKQRYKGHQQIIALETQNSIGYIDVLLTKYDKSLEMLFFNQKLKAVFSQPVPAQICAMHFQAMKMLGKGGFSKVILVRKKDTGELFACKIIEKNYIMKIQKQSQIMNERNILAAVHHPFIADMYWAFQSMNELQFVMEYYGGGVLYNLLEQKGSFSESEAKFIFCEVLLGLEYLHNLNIIYRDLKSENILLDLDGHIKLVDFGLSKQLQNKHQRTSSYCGSPEYIAPEIIRGQEYGFTVDFYSLGILLFEMLTGYSPFYDEDMSKLQDNILNQKLILPNFISQDCQDIITKLLNRNQNRRLGYIDGVKDIKKHKWVKDYNWYALFHRQIQSPFDKYVMNCNYIKNQSMVDLYFPLANSDTEDAVLSVSNMNTYEYNPFEGFDYNSEDFNQPSMSVFQPSISLVDTSYFHQRSCSKTERVFQKRCQAKFGSSDYAQTLAMQSERISGHFVDPRKFERFQQYLSTQYELDNESETNSPIKEVKLIKWD